MAKSGKTSFEHDIRPLFTETDMLTMGERNVFLGDYDFMKLPANAKMVLAYVSGERDKRMPPQGWPADKLKTFRSWINDGLKP